MSRRYVQLLSPFSLLLLAGCAVLLAAALAGCDSAGSDPGTVAVTGRVTNGAGRAVENARLEVTVPGETGSDMFSAHTDTSGRYRLEVSVPTSMEVAVQVFSDAMSTERVITLFPDEDRSDIDFVLGEGEGGAGVERAVVAGRVSTVEGAAASDARVVVSGGETASGGPYTAPVDSATGRYRLKVPITGSTELTLEAHNDAFTAQRIVTVFPKKTRSGIDFVLGQGTFTVSGAVTDGDGHPLAKARVEVPTNAQMAGTQAFSTQTGPDGTYSLDVEITSSTDLTVRAVSGEQSSEQVVTAFPGESRSGVDLVLGNSTATITGSVIDGDGAAVEGARVETTADGQSFSTQTGADGSYSLAVQIASSTELTVRAVSDDLTAEQTVTIFPGEARQGVNFVLGASTATITGSVTDGDGNTVQGARVEAQAAGEMFSTQTDGDGAYTLDVAIAGATDLTVRAVSDDLTAEQTVTLFPGDTRSGIDFVLGNSTTTVEGVVTDGDGNAVDDARVETSTDGQTFSTQTTANGSYSLDVGITASTDLTVRAVDDALQAEKIVTVVPGETETNVDFVLGNSTASVEGAVNDGDGDAVSGARVEADAAGQTFTTQTDADGSYTLNVQITASTDLTVRAVSDDLTAEQTVTIFPGETRQGVNFVLGGSTATISGRVTDGDDPDGIDARVETTGGGQTFSTQTGADGTYTLTVQIASPTELTVRAVSDDREASQTVTVAPGQTETNVDFALGSSTGGGTGVLKGLVTDGDGHPVEEARVEVPATDQTVGSQPFTTLTGADGTYRLEVEMRSSAELTVHAISDDRQTQQLVTVVPGVTKNIDLVLGSSTGEGTATVEGHVANSEGDPVRNARLEVPASDQTIGSQSFTTLTDEEGNYSLDVDLRSSTEVELRATRDDLTATKTVTLVPDETRPDIDFVLGGSTENSGTATLEGTVTDGDGDPVTSARVAAQPNEETVSDQAVTTRTGPGGAYSLDVDITASTDLTVRATSDGRTAERVVTVFPDEARPGTDFSFEADGGGDGDASGSPSNIQLLDVSRTTIGIQGSGSPETSEITYQVADSAGRPVSLDHETTVHFDLSKAGAQDASIAPSEVTTNDEGKVTANLSSGTDAGTVQIVASVNTGDGEPISSRPVSVTIHGGLPVERNFFLRSSQTNVAARAESRDVTVITEVGDQYNNPVKPETAVYFTTDGKGIIEGSTLTDERGRGSVELSLTGASAGDIVVATAETANRQGTTISAETGLFLSGASTITLDETTAELGQTYTLTVDDEQGYPLAPGTNISVVAEGTKVKAVGNTNVTLDDYGFTGDTFAPENIRRGAGITEFTFRTAEDRELDEDGEPTLEAITVTVTSPNGDLEIVLTKDPSGASGTNVVTSTRGATVIVRPDGSAVVQR